MISRAEIVLRLDDVNQLVKSLPPSPFPRRRLRREAEEFILEQATTFPHSVTFVIRAPNIDANAWPFITEAVREHFGVRRKEEQKELERVRRFAWRSLIIGLAFLSITLVMVQLMRRYLPAGNFVSVVEGGLTVLAWVALWKPGELLLYDWIPFRRDARLFSRLEHADIELGGPPSAPDNS